MIVIISGKMQIPENERFIGFVGDNLHSTKQFLITDSSDENCIYRLYLTFDDGTVNYFVLDSKVENGSTLLTWTILEEHIFKSGVVNAQIKCFCSEDEVYHTTSDYFIVGDSTEYSDEFVHKDNAEFLRYERELNSILSVIQSGDYDFVPTDRQIAGLDLVDDINANELNKRLGVYPAVYSSSAIRPYSQNIGQLEYVGSGLAGQLKGLHVLLYKDDNSEFRVKLVTSDELSDYVKLDRTIAGLDLSDDITAEELRTACQVPKIILSTQVPSQYYRESFAKTGDLYFYVVKNELYILKSKVVNNNSTSESDKYRYSWQKVSADLQDNNTDLYAYASKIQDAQSPSTLTLALMADTHYCDNDKNAQEKLDTANKMALLSNYVHIDAIANLGDFVAGNEAKQVTQNDLKKIIVNTNQNAKCPVFYVRGNHDDNGWYSYGDFGGTYKTDEIINNAQWYQTAFSFTHSDVVIDENNKNGGYGYYDHEKSKIRVFLLNSSDIPYITENDGTYRYNAFECYAFSNEQLNFVANALKFEDKDNPNEWAAMFLMHIPLDTTKTSGYHFGGNDTVVRGTTQMLSIISAYRKGISYSFSGSVNLENLGELAEDFTITVDVDYSSKGVGDVICFVNGHTHVDNCSQKVGYEGSLSYGYTYLGVMGSTAFATIVVDRENSIVTTFKYGDVTTLSDMSGREDYEGMIDGETEFDIDMKTGVWTIPFEQFRPTDDNLFAGFSQLWGDGYAVDSSATLDLQTMELTNAKVNQSWILSKGMAVKASTQYVISPDSDNCSILVYAADGSDNGTLTATEENGMKIITTRASGGYLVFAFHKPSYPDYENFYIKEYVSESGE